MNTRTFEKHLSTDWLYTGNEGIFIRRRDGVWDIADDHVLDWICNEYNYALPFDTLVGEFASLEPELSEDEQALVTAGMPLATMYELMFVKRYGAHPVVERIVASYLNDSDIVLSFFCPDDTPAAT